MTRTSTARVLGGTLAVLAFSADVASAGNLTVRPTLPNVKIQTPNHKQQIQINSFQWGVGRGITQPNGAKSDREGSSPSVSEIVVTKPKSKLSPSKLLESATGAP
jgi:Type VI secretion system effector, Hcp